MKVYLYLVVIKFEKIYNKNRKSKKNNNLNMIIIKAWILNNFNYFHFVYFSRIRHNMRVHR